MPRSSFRPMWVLLATACVGSLGCHVLEPETPAEPEETVVESEGRTEVVVTKLAPESSPEAPATQPPVSPREGVHETDQETRGRLGKDKVRSVLDAHNAAFTQCYADVLAKKPGLAGKVTLLLVISPQGKVPHAHVVQETTTLEDAEVHKCLINQALSLTFEKPVGGRVVTQYPLDFKAEPAATSGSSAVKSEAAAPAAGESPSEQRSSGAASQ